MNRISRCAALIGTVLSLSSFAQDCQEISLYKNGEIGNVVTGNFPENPEWSTNWGNLDGMTPPYIRLSGQKDKQGGWSNEFTFGNMPARVNGGNLNLKIRSTQKGKAKVWLMGNFGKGNEYTIDVEENKTYTISVPVKTLAGAGEISVSRIGVGLKNVPAYQYITLFIDDVGFSCGSNSDISSNSETEIQEYFYSDINPADPVREGKFMDSKVSEVSAAYNQELRQNYSNMTTLDFVVSVGEQFQIQNYSKADNLTAKKSRDGWFRSLYQLERNRLKDGVIANPKALYYEAQAFAASSDNRSMPLLLANVDYGFQACEDTLCEIQKILPGRLLLGGFPLATVNGSVVNLYYDPYFVTTNRKELPSVEIYRDGVWEQLLPKSHMELRFESAGAQKVKVRLSEGGVTVNQNLFVEVK